MTLIVRNFGAAVRRLRELQGWSQEQLAEYAGLNRSYVGEIERGSAIASIVTVDKLARAFGVSIECLLRSSSDQAGVILPEASAPINPAPAS
ncbi:helix-turn-helix family protein [Paraburkholderia xenovorans LB400]|uniref:Transcriptional regulator, XRE family n=1 Tax=Paraburkholderia xenovorans (strain LB400) TaxID=266265 RepID=Q13IP2_PARXL|nr:helix-turn-helix transcriptional regulator [Paraburkholderia xenovorans]ABE36047.1 transcriptional regulator, XRE family [Paraburkholderia xenovorans LB400]AIP35161.1 helix-turn-helix family protein [Paraburkholderia xenovorans LB400]